MTLLVIVLVDCGAAGCAATRWIPGDDRQLARGSWSLADGETAPGMEVRYEIEPFGAEPSIRILWATWGTSGCETAILPLRGGRIEIPEAGNYPALTINIHSSRRATVTFQWTLVQNAPSAYRLKRTSKSPNFGCE